MSNENVQRGREPLPSILDTLPRVQQGRGSSNSVNTTDTRTTTIMPAFSPTFQNDIDNSNSREEAQDLYNNTTFANQLTEMELDAPKIPKPKKAPTFLDRMKDTFTTVKNEEEVDPNGENEVTVKQEVLFCLLATVIVVIVLAVSLSLQ